MKSPPENVDKAKVCGKCSACCKLMAIAELEKPHFSRCQHLCGQGCSIYPDRPPTCREYECLWKSDVVKEDVDCRPDKLGVVFHPTQIDNLKIIELWEIEPGAARRRKTKRLVRRLLKSGEFDDYQVIPAGQEPGANMNLQLKFLKIKDEWRFQELVQLH